MQVTGTMETILISHGFGKSASGTASPIGGNGDCANFVSQCLFAGGLTFKETGSANRQWYYYTKGGSYKKKSSS